MLFCALESFRNKGSITLMSFKVLGLVAPSYLAVRLAVEKKNLHFTSIMCVTAVANTAMPVAWLPQVISSQVCTLMNQGMLARAGKDVQQVERSGREQGVGETEWTDGKWIGPQKWTDLVVMVPAKS